ncbi:apolipoprotein N-acyltransferase [Desulfatiglans anilini]|uniref:apolipoprotein N-acyltransferase n=1 Tax=Desulfatiglans anilini TaxID=90728 RepID=UPI0003F623F8|nr:apolipoprotein N-acyltransferase [Desulfatiglans anilini]
MISRHDSSRAANQAAGASPSSKSGLPRFLRFSLAAASGLVLSAALPPSPFGWLAWAAVIPLFWAVEGLAPAAAFRIGLFAGFVHYLTLLYWILFVLGHYGGLHPLLAVPPLVMLSLYLALYPALFSAGWRLLADLPAAAFWGAGLWTVLELLRGRLMSGFPWCPLGVSQFENLSLIQMADIAGTGGLSFLIVFINVALYRLLRHPRTAMTLRGGGALLIGVFFLGAALAYGFVRLDRYAGPAAKSEQGIEVALVQANIDQSLKWDAAYQDRTLELYRTLTKSATKEAARLVVWPETAAPFFFGPDQEDLSEHIRQTARDAGVPILFGSPAYERDDARTRYFNRAYLLSGEGSMVGSYDKVHLVPFGEYVPLKRLLFFIDRLVPAAGDFTEGPGPLPIRHRDLALGVLICFEAVFPKLAREQVQAGANLLVNITNDAWFGRSSAPYQHLAMSVFRAVENRTSLVRAANTGISAFVSPAGEVLERSPIFTEAVLVHSVPLAAAPGGTVYTRWGDGWIVGLGGMLLVRLALAWRRRR